MTKKTSTKILVTGGAGMIGSNLVKRLIKEGNHVKVVDNLWRGKLDYLYEDDKSVIDLENDFYNRDLSIAGSCDDLLDGIEIVYHLADIVAGIDYVFSNQGSLFRQNNLINSNVISSVRTFGKKVKGFIYVGTACSFPLTRQNSLDVIPLREEELYPALPESAYGWSKLMGQYETDLLEKETGIPCSVLMFHNVYGSPCDYGERSQVIPALIRKAINFPKEEFIVWGSGEQGRAFIHVNDVVNALCLTKDKGLGKGVIQIGPSVCTSIKEIAETVVEISGRDIKVEYDTTKPEGDKARSADYSKAQRILGWEPLVDLRSGLEQQFKWIKNVLRMKGVIYKNLKSIVEESTTHAIGSKRILLKGTECESMLTQAAIGSLLEGEFVENHTHPTMEEYFFFTKGEAKLTIDKTEYSCEKDTFIKIPKNTIHSLMAITAIDFIYWGIAI